MVKKKQKKEKIYFVIPWSKNLRTDVTKSFLGRIGLITLGAFLLIAIGLGSGTLQLAVATVRCAGLPVQASDFMASSTYYLPGQSGYGPDIFNNYSYCTKEQVESAGYRPSILSEEAKQEAFAQQEARKEAERFSADKVSYQVYIPVLEGYSVDQLRLSEIKGNQHTFMRIKKNGTVIGSIRELKHDDNYNICIGEKKPNGSYCELIGNDTQGREINRYFPRGLNNRTSNSVSIQLDGTGIILESDNDIEAVQLLSSLQRYSKELVK